CVRFQSNFDYW
nr:immunoglobulin heavy chain junction region [Macaca mulatta]